MDTAGLPALMRIGEGDITAWYFGHMLRTGGGDMTAGRE
jgi:hypothetical protein